VTEGNPRKGDDRFRTLKGYPNKSKINDWETPSGLDSLWGHIPQVPFGHLRLAYKPAKQLKDGPFGANNSCVIWKKLLENARSKSCPCFVELYQPVFSLILPRHT
jgi:hypothetical protein